MIATKIVGKPPAGPWDAVAVPVPAKTERVPESLKALDKATGGVLGRALASGDVKGGAGEVTVLYPAGGGKIGRILVTGVGKNPQIRAVRDGLGAAARRADLLGVKRLVAIGWGDVVAKAAPYDVIRAAAEGGSAGCYTFLRHRARRDEDGASGALREVQLVLTAEARDAKEAAAEGAALADARAWAMDLSNEPANHLSPDDLAEATRKMARGRPIKVTVLGPAELKRLGMGALLGVAQGSHEPPCLILAEYRPRGGRPIGLVGKGIMFDTGGISIKPAGNMHKMKMDMSGGAGVLAAIRAAADLRLPVPVIAAVPATYNMPDGNAQRPGDVVTAYNGKTIEVLNTDAEGRLVLADALSYVDAKYKPRCLVDMATLTGAVQVALGRYAIGAMTNDAKLLKRVTEAGESVGERCWELPLWDDYLTHTKSPVADLQNIGPPGEAGTIMGAAFLKAFVSDTPWVHLDIASVAWQESGGGWSNGAGVRLLTEFLRRESGR